LIGREAEMDRLRGRLERACTGHGSLVLLVGEPGIGKTRIAEELAVYAWLRDARAVWGRCHEGEGAPAYWPWVQVIRALANATDAATLQADMGSRAADIAEVVPAVKARLPDLAGPPAVEPAQARFRLFESITSYLIAVSARQPLVVVLDDLHSADAPSLLLLAFLARELRDTRVLVVGTYRDLSLPEEHPLSRALAELTRESIVERVELRGLGELDMARFIANVLGQPAPPGLTSAVWQLTDGNPFFLIEVVRLLVQEGRLEQPYGAAGWQLGIPPGVRDALSRRLQHLGAGCRRVLEIAAVIGREFSLTQLAAVWATQPEASEHNRRGLLTGLDEALAARLIAHAPVRGGAYRFAHALIRETLYDGLGAVARARLHRRVGEALEGLYVAELDGHLTELATHFGYAALDGEVERAVSYAERAGAQASQLLAYEAAAAHYTAALQALELAPPASADERRRSELLLALGEAQARVGTQLEARASFRRASTVARHLLWSNCADEVAASLLARAALGYAGPRPVLGNVDQAAVRLLEEALACVCNSEPAMRARLLGRLATELYHSQQRQRCLDLSLEALETARQTQDVAVLADSLWARHQALWEPATIRERLATATEIVDLAESSGDRELAVRGHGARVLDLLELGEVAAAERDMAAHGRLAGELRQPSEHWQAAVYSAMRALLKGQWEEAERLADTALALGQRMDSASARQAYLVQLFWIRRESGRLAELESPVLEMLAQYSLTGWLFALAWLYADLGRREDARRALMEASEHDPADLPSYRYWLNGGALMADVCAVLGETQLAARLYALLEPYAGRLVISITGAACRGAVDRYLARLAATLGWRDRATRHFEAALELNARAEAWPWLAHTQHDFAKFLLDHDRARGQRLLTRALATARTCGMHLLTQQVETLLREVGPQPVAPLEPTPAGLTDREVDVLRLVASGRSNKEIAAELVVSVHTIERHLANIYRKIDARTRVDATGFALRHGLAVLHPHDPTLYIARTRFPG
jgi:DNA-binding CsgD family transcriptional regulator/tetratricopeptide (TPR) repeat protein